MTVVALIRHGETARNLAGLFQGQSDDDLHATGAGRFMALAGDLAHIPIGHIYASPMRRALRSARLLCLGRAIAPQIDHDLRERHLGQLDGLDKAQTLRSCPGLGSALLLPDFAPERGERGDDGALRLRRTVARFGRAHPGVPVLAVTHGGVSALFGHHCLGIARDQCFLDHGEAHVVRARGDGTLTLISPKVNGARLAALLAA